MDTTTSTLIGYRRGLYDSFTHSRDALLEVTDALLSYPAARSFVELSEAVCMRRRWPSLYQALSHGRLEECRLRAVWAVAAPLPPDEEPPVLGLDTVSVHRPLAHTYPGRTWVHASNLPPTSRPVRPGWDYSTLAVLPDPPSARVYWLDVSRVDSTHTAVEVGASQLSRVSLPGQRRPLLLADSRYASAVWVRATSGLECAQLLRAPSNRVLFRPPPPPTGKRGGPRKDGARFQGKDPDTHGQPDGEWHGTDRKGKELTVSCWRRRLHLRTCRDVQITVVRVLRASARDTKRDPRESWFWHWAGELPPLETIPELYARRYSLEHAYRYGKQDLLRDKPHLRTPEQMSRWALLVASVHNELLLAAPLIEPERRPWERRGQPPTLGQLRRSMARLLARLGTPVRCAQPRGKSPGRAKGAIVRHAPTQPVLKKATSALARAPT